MSATSSWPIVSLHNTTAATHEGLHADHVQAGDLCLVSQLVEKLIWFLISELLGVQVKVRAGVAPCLVYLHH